MLQATIPVAILVAMPLVLAADVAESLAGGAGWVGTGLLGAVLAWLCYVRLPANDRMLQALIADKDKILADKDKQLAILLEHKWAAISQLSSDHREAVKGLAAEFRAVTVEISRHCDGELDRLSRLIEGKTPPPPSPPSPSPNMKGAT
jgi:hypothetical protein